MAQRPIKFRDLLQTEDGLKADVLLQTTKGATDALNAIVADLTGDGNDFRSAEPLVVPYWSKTLDADGLLLHLKQARAIAALQQAFAHNVTVEALHRRVEFVVTAAHMVSISNEQRDEMILEGLTAASEQITFANGFFKDARQWQQVDLPPDDITAVDNGIHRSLKLQDDIINYLAKGMQRPDGWGQKMYTPQTARDEDHASLERMARGYANVAYALQGKMINSIVVLYLYKTAYLDGPFGTVVDPVRELSNELRMATQQRQTWIDSADDSLKRSVDRLPKPAS